jgi:energy-coupling factor transporter ATP-binding protein EcfA2
MKIARAVIENFRHIERLELDFTDSLGRVRDVSLIVGPNMSGKTTILDALAVAIGKSTGQRYTRPGFIFSPRTIVRRGALHATVTCEVRFSPEEIDTTRKLFELTEDDRIVPNAEGVRVIWTFPPDPDDRKFHGSTIFEPPEGQTLFMGRRKVAQLVPTERVDFDWFKRVGGIVTFNQQRSMHESIEDSIWDTMRGTLPQSYSQGQKQQDSDVRAILLAMAIHSLVPTWPDEDVNLIDPFKLIQERYAQMCAPHKIIGAVRNELGETDLLFSDGTHEYGYEGLSSGEQMLLLFLAKMANNLFHQSVVLVDEIELHQHPIWQRRLLHLLPKIGENNQIIATTHSEYLREVMPRGAVLVLELGELIESLQPARE